MWSKRALTSGLALICASTVVSADAIQQSLRPNLRPAIQLVSLDTPATQRPILRPVKASPEPVQAPSDSGLRTWINSFKPRASAAGITPAVFERAFKGVRYDPDVIKRDRNQSEFTKTIWDYLDTAVSDLRIENGKTALAAHAKTLVDIEAKYGVEKEVVVAVWGLESAYGSFRGSNDIIGSLATLAYDGRRGAFFEEQLIAALKILQNGDTSPRTMTGSWAGAMGHTQFMPTSYLDYAVDFTGDGKRDIWSEDPTDALASTAAYLAAFGWKTGMPWGVEVRLPKGFDYTQANRDIQKLPSGWARMGVLGANGTIRDHGPAAVLLPAGGDGAAFLVFDNFEVIERYNTADAYVIGVGHLSDRIKGLPPIRGAWPRGDRALTLQERTELQEELTRKGFDTQGVDGKIGPKTVDAVRSYQISMGLIPDGYASLRLLNTLR